MLKIKINYVPRFEKLTDIFNSFLFCIKYLTCHMFVIVIFWINNIWQERQIKMYLNVERYHLHSPSLKSICWHFNLNNYHIPLPKIWVTLANALDKVLYFLVQICTKSKSPNRTTNNAYIDKSFIFFYPKII